MSTDAELDAELRASFTAALRAGRYVAHCRTDGRPVTADDLEKMTQAEFDDIEFRDAPQ
jgi:hypothetical protein